MNLVLLPPNIDDDDLECSKGNWMKNVSGIVRKTYALGEEVDDLKQLKPSSLEEGHVISSSTFIGRPPLDLTPVSKLSVVSYSSVTGSVRSGRSEMETKNSILNALLQQAIFNSQGVGANVPVNLSMSLNDERSEVTSSSSSVEDESPADLSSRSNHRDDSPTPPHYQHHPDSSQLMHAMAAAFSFQRDLLAQQQNKSELHQPDIVNSSLSSSPDPSHLVAKALASATMRRPRSEKKPIPDDLKDGKYFERRRRNNLAAKRSRDMRKNREDQVTVRANFLEKENSVLRAQVATLRDEAFALKQMLLHKQASAILRSQAATS